MGHVSWQLKTLREAALRCFNLFLVFQKNFFLIISSFLPNLMRLAWIKACLNLIICLFKKLSMSHWHICSINYSIFHVLWSIGRKIMIKLCLNIMFTSRFWWKDIPFWHKLGFQQLSMKIWTKWPTPIFQHYQLKIQHNKTILRQNSAKSSTEFGHA